MNFKSAIIYSSIDSVSNIIRTTQEINNVKFATLENEISIINFSFNNLSGPLLEFKWKS